MSEDKDKTLSSLIAEEVMGWKVYRNWPSYISYSMDDYGSLHPCTKEEVAEMSQEDIYESPFKDYYEENAYGTFLEIPCFKDDLNECRAAEERVSELGLSREYIARLGEKLNISGSRVLDGWLKLVMAPAEIKCKAMLEVVRENKCPA